MGEAGCADGSKKQTKLVWRKAGCECRRIYPCAEGRLSASLGCDMKKQTNTKNNELLSLQHIRLQLQDCDKHDPPPHRLASNVLLMSFSTVFEKKKSNPAEAQLLLLLRFLGHF